MKYFLVELGRDLLRGYLFLIGGIFLFIISYVGFCNYSEFGIFLKLVVVIGFLGVLEVLF